MPISADGGAKATAPASIGARSDGGGPKINPATGLSTDYLNHFTEAVMLLELVPTMPECIDDLRQWQPRTYAEHFRASHFSNRDTIIATYQAAAPKICDALHRNAELLNAITKRTCELVLQYAGMAEIDAIARRALERLRPLIARTAAIINGTPPEATDQYSVQAAIDAMFGR